MGLELEGFFFFFERLIPPGKIHPGWSRKNIGASVQILLGNRDIPKLEMTIPWGWFDWNLCFPAWNNERCAVQKIPKKVKNGERKELPPNP